MEVDWHNIETAIFDGRDGIENLAATTPVQVAKECGGQFSFFYFNKYWCPSDIDCEGKYCMCAPDNGCKDKLCDSPAIINDRKIYKCNLGGD